MNFDNTNFWLMYDSELNIHYIKRYINIIKSILNKSNRDLEYSEIHHIIPVSIDSSFDKKEFTIRLTAREHYIVHMILARCFKNNLKYKMEHAFTMMVFQKNMYDRDYKVSSRIYEKCRLLNQQRMKQIMNTPEMKEIVSKRQHRKIKEKYNGKTFFDSTGIPAYNKGKMCITNGVSNKYISKDEKIPDGWWKGSTQKKKGEEWKQHLKDAWKNNKENRVGENHPMYGKGYLLEGSKNGRYIDGRYCNKKGSE